MIVLRGDVKEYEGFIMKGEKHGTEQMAPVAWAGIAAWCCDRQIVGGVWDPELDGTYTLIGVYAWDFEQSGRKTGSKARNRAGHSPGGVHKVSLGAYPGLIFLKNFKINEHNSLFVV